MEEDLNRLRLAERIDKKLRLSAKRKKTMQRASPLQASLQFPFTGCLRKSREMIEVK